MSPTRAEIRAKLLAEAEQAIDIPNARRTCGCPGLRLCHCRKTVSMAVDMTFTHAMVGNLEIPPLVNLPIGRS